jgi:hypothetical protein
VRVTDSEVLDVRMVEFDHSERYQRQSIPSQGGLVSWYRPVGDNPDEFKFVLVPTEEHFRLEGIWQLMSRQ